MNKFSFIFLIFFIVSCSEELVDKENTLNKRNIGVQISNHMIGGSTYSDSAKKLYAFRSIRGLIKNDTVVPIKIQFDIPTTWTDLEPKQGQKYVCFLLPDSMNKEKQFDARGQVSSQLNSFINSKSKLLTTRTLTILPNDTFSYKIGFLIIPTEGAFNAILFSEENPRQQTNEALREKSIHDLRLYVTLPPVSSVISIGRLQFLNE